MRSSEPERLRGGFALELPAEGGWVDFDAITWDWDTGDTFRLYGEQVARVRGAYTVEFAPPADEPRHRFVQVVFSLGGKPYDYRCDDETIGVGDTVKVNSALQGDTEARVVGVREKRVSELPLRLDEYKFVLGKA